MAALSDYVTGTLTVTNGSVNFTGTSTGWLLAGFKEGDTIIDITGATEYMGVVATIDANGAGTLTKAWEGPDLVDVAYRMRYQPDGARVSAQARNLIELLGNGNLQAVAGLSGSANQVLMFTGPGTMTTVPKTDLVSGVSYDVQVDLLADRAAYDGQAEGFTVLVANAGDGRAAVYSKASATSGDWTNPAYVTGAAVTLDVTEVDEVPYGTPPDVTLTPIGGGYNLAFDIPRGMLIEPGTTTTLAPGLPAVVTFVPITGGYRLDIALPAGEGFSSEGDYDAGTAYAKGDVTQRFGSSWIAKQVTTGNAPPTLPTTSNAHWQLLARQGVDGAGTVISLLAGAGVSVDSSDPTAPVVALSNNRFSFASGDLFRVDTTIGYSGATYTAVVGEPIYIAGFLGKIVNYDTAEYDLVSYNGLRVQLELSASGDLSLVPFDVPTDGTTDVTAYMQAAIDAAIRLGVNRIVGADNVYNIAGSLANRSNVTFIGSGVFVGPGSYRVRCVPANAPAPVALNTLLPAKHLSRLASTTEELVVVVVGDSISTLQPNTLGTSPTFYSALIEKIKKDNPNKTIKFYNRSIGGWGWGQAAGFVYSLWPDWFTNHELPWMHYAQVLNPDVIIFAFGMNDGFSDAFGPEYLRTTIATVNSWVKVPNIIFTTCALPTLDNPYHPTYGTKVEQEGRERSAGFTRQYADFYGYGCIDINRMANMARDGRDPLNTELTRTVTGLDISGTGSYVAEECSDFSIRVSSGAGAFDGVNTLGVKIGPRAADVVLIVNASGKIRLDFYYTDLDTNAPNYSTVLTDIDTPVGLAFDLTAERRNGQFLLRIAYDGPDDVGPTDLAIQTPIIVNGGVYEPKIGWYNANFASGPFNSVQWFNMGVPSRVMPTLTDEELWGTYGVGTTTDKLPYGGNGINHPDSLAHARVFAAAVYACNFGVTDGYCFATGGGYEITGGNISRVFGRWGAGTTGARIDASIAYPVTVPTGTYRLQLTPMIDSVGLSTEYLKGAQTIVNSSRPTQTGFDISVHCPVNDGAGRLVDWELTILPSS